MLMSCNFILAKLQIDYPSFARNFYEEHSEITALTKQELFDLKKKMGIKVTGYYEAMISCVIFIYAKLMMLNTVYTRYLKCVHPVLFAFKILWGDIFNGFT